MKSPQSEVSTSSSVHSENIQRELSQLIEHLKADTHRVDDPRFRGLLDKSVDVLKGLRSLFERFGPADQSRASQRASASDSARDRTRTPVQIGKKSENKKSDPRPKSGASVDPHPETEIKAPSVRLGKASQPAKKKAAATQSKGSIATTEPGVATPKPQDPDEMAAKAQQQRREARAPKMPGGQAAPRPIPSQSGKPIWSKPHSS